MIYPILVNIFISLITALTQLCSVEHRVKPPFNLELTNPPPSTIMSPCKETRPQRKSHHWFISVFLELYKAHASDVLQVVPVLRLKVIVVAVEVRQGWWSDSHRFFAVDLVSDHIVCLQQRLKHNEQSHSKHLHVRA